MIETEERAGLRDVAFRLGYDTADEALRDFYVPALSRSTRYDRSVGYFRASALAVAARGVSRFIASGGTMRLLVGAEVRESDTDALRGALEIPREFAERLRKELVPEDEIARRRLEVLGWLAREGRLHVRVAIAVDERGEPVPQGQAVPYFHEKIGILRDHRGDGVAFQGSVNESATAWTHNFESFSVYRSWGGVTPFPHQRQVVERLAGEYPRSWLVADEVGLGKTISAGLSLRRLLFSGEVKRALILAPANVCRQWQDELFEKFGIWAHRFDGHRLHGAHPVGVNPYDAKGILIVSSHLARRSQHQRLLLAALPFDLIVVDEAHHARRQGFQDLTRYRLSRLMHLLDQLAERDLLPAVWLLTATPMQVHPMELRDLLRYVGLTGALEDWSAFQRFFAELAKEEPERTDWTFLSRMLAGTPLPPLGPAEEAFLARVEAKLGPIQRARIERFGQSGDDADMIANDLGASGRRELRVWLRQRSPVGQLVTRHTRETLKWYRAQGLLNEPVADRDVDTKSIVFTPEEQELYEDLDRLLDRLMEAHGSRQGAGFVLTIYRRRLTSSWHAIHRTLIRRLDREGLALELDLLDEDEVEDLDTGDETTVDDAEAVPLTRDHTDELRSYVDRIEVVQDSKFDQLVRDLNEARSSGHATIVFTQFTDTLDVLRDRLSPTYRSQLATYTGNGGCVFRDEQGGLRYPNKSSSRQSMRPASPSFSRPTRPARDSTSNRAAT